MGLWFGIAGGVSVMAGHTLLRILTHRWALRRSEGRTFLLFELGGLGIRMALVLGAVGLVLAFVPVHEAAFVGTVLLLLVVSMVVEVRLIVRRIDQGALG